MPHPAVIALAAATTFHPTPIVANGNTNIAAVAINNGGLIAATINDPATGTAQGAVIRGNAATILPPPYPGSANPIPRAINNRGHVLGYAYEGIQPHMFLLKNNAYDPAYDVALVIEQQPGPDPLPIGVNDRDAVFYTIVTGRDNPTDPIYGIPPHLHSMPHLMVYQTAESLNDQGVLAGTTFFGGNSKVFAGRGAAFQQFLPAGAATASGGYINNSNEVAGIDTDAAGTQHGFTTLNGATTSFDPPDAPLPYTLTVSGLNNSGRVVGTYVSAATGRPTAFLFNGTTASIVGTAAPQDTISITLNDAGTLLVARLLRGDPANARSYRVTCSGPGC